MSRNLSDLLQQCLEAYDAGLSPEECLSAFPRDRRVLEPLLRQALSLRIAFTHAPSEDFQERTRERILFAAGREVSHAFASEPRTEFVDRARQRLIRSAGANAQEALRSVPPPRLPFWWNARRRLLEAAVVPRPRPVFRPSFALRAGLSAAVVVLAIGIAGAAYLASERHPTSVNAEFAYIEQRLTDVEQRAAAGESVSPAVLTDLLRRTNELASKLEDQPTPVTEKLPALVKRQKEILNSTAPPGARPPELVQAQQQLNQAEQKMRELAARNDPAPQPSANTNPSSSSPAQPPATAAPAISLAPLQTGQVLAGPAPADTTYGMSWNEVRTTSMRFVIPSGWKVTNVTPVSPNIYALNSGYVGVDGGGSPLIVNVTTGEISALINNQLVNLRTAAGVVIPVEELVAKAGPASLELRHLLESFALTVAPQAGQASPPSTAPSIGATPRPAPAATPGRSTP